MDHRNRHRYHLHRSIRQRNAGARVPQKGVRLSWLGRRLSREGVGTHVTFTTTLGTIQPAADICQAASAMLTQVGIRTRPNIQIQTLLFPKLEKHDTSFYLLSWGGGVTSDALYTLNALLHSVGPKGEGDFNMGRWSNAEMDRLIDDIKTQTQPAARDEAIRKALVLANRELPVVTIHQQRLPWAGRKNVNAWFSPVNTVYFYRVRIE